MGQMNNWQRFFPFRFCRSGIGEEEGTTHTKFGPIFEISDSKKIGGQKFEVSGIGK